MITAENLLSTKVFDMIITLCGKGGCGKSTTATLLAKEFVREGKPVLVIDTDESNFGLHRQLGMELPKDFTQYFGGKQGILEKVMGKAKFQHDFFDHKWKISDIPSEYLSEKDGVKLLAIGKIHESGEGCACPMGIIARQFISNLKLDPNEVVITDTEAGIEHFGRGVETDVDAILMVIDPSYESLQLSAKVAELSESIHKPLYYVLNKVNASNESLMKEAVKDKSKIIAVIPTNDSISMAGLKGDELNAEWSGIKGLADFLSENVC